VDLFRVTLAKQHGLDHRIVFELGRRVHLLLVFTQKVKQDARSCSLLAFLFMY
jgi:hypothetical protein